MREKINHLYQCYENAIRRIQFNIDTGFFLFNGQKKRQVLRMLTYQREQLGVLKTLVYLDNDLTNQEELIKAQREYIEFLGDEVGRLSTMESVRPYLAPDEETIKKGEELRAKIKEYEKGI